MTLAALSRDRPAFSVGARRGVMGTLKTARSRVPKGAIHMRRDERCFDVSEVADGPAATVETTRSGRTGRNAPDVMTLGRFDECVIRASPHLVVRRFCATRSSGVGNLGTIRPETRGFARVTSVQMAAGAVEKAGRERRNPATTKASPIPADTGVAGRPRLLASWTWRRAAAKGKPWARPSRGRATTVKGTAR